MDQKEIDEILKRGDLGQFDKRQQELSVKLEQAGSPLPQRQGEVIGQLSKVSEESEAGTNMVMNFLENVMTVLSKMKNYHKTCEARLQADPAAVRSADVLKFYGDTVFLVEDLIFNAMDAFQFQDINRQKLMKVMYTLAKLNEYLNELLGTEAEKSKLFGHDIENTSLQKDRKKSEIDSLISSLQKK
jgi:hypothetical protein